MTWEPWLTRGKQAPHGHLLTDSSNNPGLITDVLLAPVEIIDSRGNELRALYRAWNRAVDFVKSNPDEAHEIMAKGVGGWLKDPKVFAETLTGIVYYDKAMNEPGAMYSTVANALDIWSDFGKLQVPAKPEDLINHSVVAR